jgi:hypothetical protein
MMDRGRAKEIIESSASHFLEKSMTGTLYVKIELADIDSARLFHAICFGKPEIANGVTITEVNWGLTFGEDQIEQMRSTMLEMVKNIRPLSYTEY